MHLLKGLNRQGVAVVIWRRQRRDPVLYPPRGRHVADTEVGTFRLRCYVKALVLWRLEQPSMRQPLENALGSLRYIQSPWAPFFNGTR